ncbi:hypothetical protein E3N88_00092 [Mikania micrantha]|uniref:Protein kinase domain-containing protein n=1 Tax=Mikania micrantha TaxID=192012 RepID=A0A5N6PYW5_9ASTR|nr:hypothetical protein E3N88_00092 [Mikania micrantha]
MDQVVLCEAIGTEGYIDPEIETTRGVTQRSDTYALGVVLFEILCGKNAFLPKEADRYLAGLAKHHYENKTLKDVINPNLWNQMLGRSLMKYSKSAYSCIMDERAFWANMDDVVADLEKALEFQSRLEILREDKKVIIHNGTKCCNVCLDEKWNAKIENFEDAEFLTLNQEDEALYLPYISRNVSPFHLDLEYTKTGILKRESDVYSFGVVLFELLCGKKAADPIYLDYGGHHTHVARSRFAAGTLESMIDPVIIYPNKDSLDTYTKIAYKCVAETQAQRPSMKVVLKELEKSLSFQDEEANLIEDDECKGYNT